MTQNAACMGKKAPAFRTILFEKVSSKSNRFDRQPQEIDKFCPVFDDD